MAPFLRWIGSTLRGAGAAALVVVVGGCATTRVNSYVARDVNFTGYRSYNWVVTDRLSTGDPRLDNNPFFQRRLQSEVERYMTRRGLAKQEAGTSDLVLHYHASVSQEIDVAGLDRQFGHCELAECQPFVYEAGTIVLDLVDARTNKLVWRGWAEGSLEGAIDDQDWLEEHVDEAVAKIMERLPRAL